MTTMNQEDEQMFQRAFDWLNHARDTFINASELAKEVQELRDAVFQFKGELDTMRSANAVADDTINTLRSQRNEAQQNMNIALQDLARMTTDRDYWRNSQANAVSQVANLTEELASVKSGKESAELELMYAQDEIKRLNGQLVTIRNVFQMTEKAEADNARDKEQAKALVQDYPLNPAQAIQATSDDHGPDYGVDPNRNPDGTFRGTGW